MRNFSLCLVLVLVVIISVTSFQSSQSHLVVLVHGLMGDYRDLEYLGEQLEERGCVVLLSKKNGLTKSLAGIETGAARLVEEIREMQVMYPALDKISFVGNSLGGLFSRFALKLLSSHHYKEEKYETSSEDFYLTGDPTLANKLTPHHFMTIATPHLGVRDHNYIQDRVNRALNSDWFVIPDILKTAVSMTMMRSGQELFLRDYDKDLGETLIYRMSTEAVFVHPLKKFKRRRLYANLDNDFVVPLSTAAFLQMDEVRQLRHTHIYSEGAEAVNEAKIVHSITTPPSEELSNSTCAEYSDELHHREALYSYMRSSLDNLGWEKYVVHFPFSISPLAHNKLAALKRSPEWFFCDFLGFNQGNPIMLHAASFLMSEAEEVPEASKVSKENTH